MRKSRTDSAGVASRVLLRDLEKFLCDEVRAVSALGVKPVPLGVLRLSTCAPYLPENRRSDSFDGSVQCLSSGFLSSVLAGCETEEGEPLVAAATLDLATHIFRWEWPRSGGRLDAGRAQECRHFGRSSGPGAVILLRPRPAAQPRPERGHSRELR